jgi:hypothetical protein
VKIVGDEAFNLVPFSIVDEVVDDVHACLKMRIFYH